MQRRHFLTSAALGSIAASVACDTKPMSNSTSAKPARSRMVPVAGGKYKVWTKRVGDAPIKVLLLHGGPGVNHFYFECFEDFLPEAGIEFYYHDQLGSSFSDNPDEPGLWTVERYTDEVEEVRAALGLDQFYLYGHSWGGMLAYQYALKYGQHLKGVVISDMVADIGTYVTYVNKLRTEFPQDVQATMKKFEDAKNYEAPDYQRIIFEQLYTKHLCRLDPWPEPVDRAFKFINNKIYNYMQGPNEFVITGTMKNWDVRPELKNIRTKALVMGAKYDTMDPDEMKRIASVMPNAQSVICPNGSHLCMWDDQAFYFSNLIRFLKEG